MQTSGFYYDGRTSDRAPVEISVAPGMLYVRGSGISIATPLSAITFEEAVGGGRSVIRFPDGGMCAFEDASFSRRFNAVKGEQTFFSLVRRWEKSLLGAAMALVILVVAVTAAVQYGVPALSQRVAFMIPQDAEKRMGKETLATLDRILLKPSELPKERADQLRLLFRDVAQEAQLGESAHILFRKGDKLGPNALALPAGIVVMTDELVLLAQDDWEIAAVMAHEAGHVQGRHSMRHILQNSLTALLISAAIGDLASASSLAATAPTLLINAKYSRSFEREADAAAARYLRNRDVSAEKFADILLRLEANARREKPETSAKQEKKEKSSLVEGYLSSHPPTRERIKELYLTH